jgi:hypothetical protein
MTSIIIIASISILLLSARYYLWHKILTLFSKMLVDRLDFNRSLVRFIASMLEVLI